jgi:hypothetical protein
MIILIGFGLALLVGAQLFPHSTPGRLLKKVTTGRWRRVLPFAVVLLALGLLLLAAPELTPLALGLDLSLMADLLLAATAVLVSFNLRRVRHLVRRTRLIATRTLRALRRPRQGRTPALRRGAPPTDDDAPGRILFGLPA